MITTFGAADPSLSARAQRVNFPLPGGAAPPLGSDVHEFISRLVADMESRNETWKPPENVPVDTEWSVVYYA